MPTVAQIFAKTLKEMGVRFVFGVPSGNMTDYIEALREVDGIDFILVGHEATASFMAGVCGKLTGIPGACFATFGPGATNLSTGVGGALLDRLPLIAFTDEMPDSLRHRTVQMNIDHQQLFRPLTKWTSRLAINNIETAILKGKEIALSEIPGPVHLGVPAGIAQQNVEQPESATNYQLTQKEVSPKLNSQVFAEAEKIFAGSKNPVLAVGLSATRAGVENLIIRIAEKFQLPVILTPMAKGLFPENHPLYGGVLFHALSSDVAKTYGAADLIIGIGYDPVEFNYEAWMPPVSLIHFDGTEADVAAEISNVLNVVGDLKNSLEKFLRFNSDRKEWDPALLEDRKKELFRKLEPPENSFGARAVVSGLQKMLPEDGILTVDVGAHLHLVGQMWRTPGPQKLLMTNGWSSMGFAVPAALAAKLCCPQLPVAAIMGDGGFQMTVGELATAKRLNLKIVFVVIIDNSLSLIQLKQKNRGFDSNYGTKLQEREVASANHYFGVPVIRATNFSEYQQALNEAFINNGPVVIEAVTSKNDYEDLLLKPNK